MHDDAPPQPDDWNADEVSQEISQHIRNMPDRPKVVAALTNWKREKDTEIMQEFAPHRAAFINFKAYQLFGGKVSVYLFGFEDDTPVGIAPFLASCARVYFDEVSVFVHGEPALRISKLRVADPEESQSDPL